jgi:hypothetical protein
MSLSDAHELPRARMTDRLPTFPLAATGLIAGFGVAISTGSRPLGGLVMAAFGLTCIYFWVVRDGTRTRARARDRRLALGARGLGHDRVGVLALVRSQALQSSCRTTYRQLSDIAQAPAAGCP